MKLIVGLTKKAGLPGFGSVGATCQLESGELPANLDAGAFGERVARAFDACRLAVETDLAKHGQVNDDLAPSPSHTAADGGGDAAARRNGYGARPSGFRDRPATPKRLNALRTLAAQS